MQNSQKLIKSILGAEVYEALNKSIVKLNTKSVVDITELHDALQIAPKSVVAFLMNNITGMAKDEAKEIKLPWDENATMLINKRDADVFTGHISKEGKIIHEFDFCSIPQLSAHILSLFELYDEVPANEELMADAPAEPKDSGELDKIKLQLQGLESKLNALIMLAAGNPLDVKKSQKDKISKAIGSLKKAGLAPTMPRPSKPGMHSGSQAGITKAGFHNPKTAETDLSVNRAQSKEKLNPDLVAGNKLSSKNGLPQQPKQPKQTKMSLKLSEESQSKCLDCGESDFHNGKMIRCSCFKALSAPDTKKNENGSTTILFKNDWDESSRIALWQSLRKMIK